MYIKKNYQVTTNIPESHEINPELWKLQDYLHSIQTDINNLHRELTYWDLYKINYVIDDVNKANGVINDLAPGQAAVIGFDKSDNIYGERRSRGDIVVKLINDQLFWIPSKSSGVYQPSTEYDDEHNCFTYTYTNQNVPEGHEIKVTAAPSENKYIYGDIFAIASADTFKTFDEVPNVRPIIRFYTPDNEIIDIDFNLSLDTENHIYTVDWHTVNPLLTNGWLQVK